MGVLREKSDQSFKTAGVLILERLYNPSIHCSYYSCIQLILDIFIEKLKHTEPALEFEARAFMVTNKKGHHVFYIHKMRQLLVNKGATPEAINSWHNDLTQLKEKRTVSDYRRIHCVPTDAEMAKKKANSVREILNKTFK